MEKRSAVNPEGIRSNRPRLALSVVTYNNSHCLPVFLESLDRQVGVDWEALFFDNASADDTVPILERWSGARIQRSAENIGYSRGHNRNVEATDAEYLVLLNADLDLAPDTLSILARHLDDHPRDAIAGPQVFEGGNREVFPPRHFYPGEGMIPLRDKMPRRDIAWLNGCCFVMRRSVFEKVGGFDEDFFLYQGETDLCLRARREGHTLGYCRDARVVHLHRQSQRESTDYDYAVRVFEGSAVFWKKHYSAHDVERMARFQYAIASLLLARGGAIRRITGLDRELSESRLRARRDVCSRLLPGGPANYGLSPRILARQARLLVAWILQRHFPLDDY
jgi:GT2 family glycosyltransferase